MKFFIFVQRTPLEGCKDTIYTRKNNRYLPIMKDFSYITSQHPAYIENLYNEFVKNLDLKYFGLTDADLEIKFLAGKFIGLENANLKTIIDHLKKCYTSSLGVEFSYVNDPRRYDWINHAVENTMLQPVSLEQKKRI